MTKFERDLIKSIADDLNNKVTDVFIIVTSSPPRGTPVDTGKARQGWQIDLSIPLQPSITNSEGHIVALNNGHSDQSPAGFFEAGMDEVFQ